MRRGYLVNLGVGISILLALIIFPTVLGGRPALADEKIYKSLSGSSFVLEGTVVKLGAVTMAAIPPSDHNVIVNVEKVLKGPPFFRHYVGREITILFKDLSPLKVGKRFVFFANGWLLGESVALTEVDQVEREDAASLQEQITAAQKRHDMEPLRKRLEEASLVVMGKVLKIVDLAAERKQAIISEHDPQWQEATINVQSVIKGQSGVETVKYLFPGSVDVAWFEVPKFKVGQEGIWLLEKDVKLEAYVVKDPLAFQEKDKLEQIRELMTP